MTLGKRVHFATRSNTGNCQQHFVFLNIKLQVPINILCKWLNVLPSFTHQFCYLPLEKTETQLNGLTRTNTDKMDADKEEVNFLLI